MDQQHYEILIHVKASGQSGTLRARESQEFRHWIDRTIEASALRIAQNRFVPEQQAAMKGRTETGISSVAPVSDTQRRLQHWY